MGWMVLLVRSVLVWLDRQSERSILQVLPDLGSLLLDPHQELKGRAVVVGPARKIGRALFLGFLLGLFAWWAVAFVLLVVLKGQGAAFSLVMVFMAVLPAAGMSLMVRWVRGGEMILRENAVELKYRGTVVVCPWAVFRMAGQPFSPAPDRIVLPVVAAAVPLVQASRDGDVVAEGMRVASQQLWFRSPGEAVLRALYEVNALELGKVLLYLGRILGSDTPAAGRALDFPLTEVIEEVPARSHSGGWLTVSLTRLVFPPACCQCGAATRGRQKFMASESFFSLGRLTHPTRNETVPVWVPVCYACQTANNRKLNRAVLNGLGAGAVLIFVAATALFLWPANLLLVLAFILSVLLGPLLGTLIFYQLSKKRVMPVQLADYSPRRGTVCMRFRRAEYGQQVLSTMEGGPAV
jgi:hypothetical protein